jgi:hypothetical protein
MKATINTNQYKAAHGKAPRGFGMWYFEATGSDGLTYELMACRPMNWSEAKKLAIAEAKEIGATKMTVLS